MVGHLDRPDNFPVRPQCLAWHCLGWGHVYLLRSQGTPPGVPSLTKDGVLCAHWH